MKKLLFISFFISTVASSQRLGIIASSINNGPPPPSWTDFTFTTTSTITQTGHVWSCNSLVGNWGSHGLDVVSFSGDVQLRAQYNVAFNDNNMLGFKLANLDESYPGLNYATYITSGGVLNWWVGPGSAGSVSHTLSFGEWYGVHRVGSTVTLETSMDGTNWTVRYTFPITTSAVLWVNAIIYDQPYTLDHPEWR